MNGLKKLPGYSGCNMEKLCGPSFTALQMPLRGGKQHKKDPKVLVLGHHTKGHCRIAGQFLCGNNALAGGDL